MTSPITNGTTVYLKYSGASIIQIIKPPVKHRQNYSLEQYLPTGVSDDPMNAIVSEAHENLNHDEIREEAIDKMRDEQIKQ